MGGGGGRGESGQGHSPAAWPDHRERDPNWVGSRTRLDGCEKSRLHRDFILIKFLYSSLRVYSNSRPHDLPHIKTLFINFRRLLCYRSLLSSFIVTFPNRPSHCHLPLSAHVLMCREPGQVFDPRTFHPVASLYTDRAILGPPLLFRYSSLRPTISVASAVYPLLGWLLN
jgi:hypothetical protein